MGLMHDDSVTLLPQNKKPILFFLEWHHERDAGIFVIFKKKIPLPFLFFLFFFFFFFLFMQVYAVKQLSVEQW